MNKIILGLIIFISSFYSVGAYDEEIYIDLWALGDLTASSPLNFQDFTIAEDNAEVIIEYNGYDCDNAGDFHMYINGFGSNISCSGGGDNKSIIETGSFTMDSGTYELYFDYSVNDFFRISDVYIKINYDPGVNIENSENIVNIENNFFGDINDYMDSEGLYTLIIIEIGFYLLALISIFIIKIILIAKKRLKYNL